MSANRGNGRTLVAARNGNMPSHGGDGGDGSHLRCGQIEGGAAAPEVSERLKTRREEKRDLEDNLTLLRAREDQRMPEPTPEWIDQHMQQMESVLASGGPAAALALRALVGGVVWVRAIELPHSDRRRLEGQFTIRAATVAQAMAGLTQVSVGDAPPVQPEHQKEIIVELRGPDVVEQIAEQVKELWDAGLTLKAIAKSVGRNRNLVMKALLLWHSQRGLPAPDTQDHKRSPRKPSQRRFSPLNSERSGGKCRRRVDCG